MEIIEFENPSNRPYWIFQSKKRLGNNIHVAYEMQVIINNRI